MKTGVLLLAHGSPDSLDEMEPYLRRVMKRRPPTPEFVEEMKRRYATFGGRSPLLDITRRQAAALEARLGLPVRVGMRHWKPYIADVAAELARQVDRIIGLPMAPHYCSLTSDAYRAALPDGADFIESWHLEPAHLDAWAEKIAKEERRPVLFTAHSVPVEAADPYERQIRETIAAVVERVRPAEWDFAWQSRSPAPGPWLEPDVDSVLRAKKWKSVLVAPIGFVADHAEILYDIDRLHRRTAEQLGMDYRRTEMLNDSPFLIEALASVVKKRL